MMAMVALRSDAPCIVEGNGLVRTGLYAGAASGTSFLVKDHDSVLAFRDHCFETSLCARGGIAMPADIRVEKKRPCVLFQFRALLPNRDQLDPIRCVHFLLACHLAGLASPAGLIVDDHGIPVHFPSG
jgi:hypothetical protein